MMKNFVRTLSGFLSLALAAWTGQPVARVGISYALTERILTLHEPVVLEFSIKNETEQSVTVDLGKDRKGGYEFWVTPPNGKKTKLPQYSRGGFSVGGKVSVGAGQTFSQNLVLDEWYGFREPGVYMIEGRLTQPVMFESVGEEQRDPGFRQSIQIGPRDEMSLAAACDSLANQMDESQGYERAAEAALALSYVADPVAVPYLRRALFAHKLVEPIAVQGLERIGDDEAIRVLGSALTDSLPSDIAVLARAALQRIEQQTSDPARKETIRAILKGDKTAN